MSEVVKEGDNVSVNYIGTLEDGEKFDSSYDRNQTLDFVVGAGQMIKGFDSALVGMKIGEKKKIKLSPQEAYGQKDKEKMISVESTKFDNFDSLKVGMQVNGGGAIGTVSEKKQDFAIIDFNHPLAGKELNFEIELVSINK